MLNELRALGWSVAIHNDYTLNGEEFTFYLFTKGTSFIKGEGRTDIEALVECKRQAEELEKLVPIDGKFGIHKYGISTSRNIVNLVSGEPIPLDEPLFLFRARDRNSLPRLYQYLDACIDDGCNNLHLNGIRQVIAEFEKFASEHPDRMKEPGVTRHLKLKGV